MREKRFGTRGLVLASLITIGVALRLWQYLADQSMWFDELSVARNISERSLSQLLTQPLGYAMARECPSPSRSARSPHRSSATRRSSNSIWATRQYCSRLRSSR